MALCRQLTGGALAKKKTKSKISMSAQKRSSARESASPSFPVVGIGASAGGLEALQRLLKALPRGLNFAFVIVQHLDPTHPSQSASILSRYSEIPVELTKNGTAVVPNHIYVVPADAAVTFENGVLNLHPREPKRHTKIIDAFLESLAKNKKAEAVGIILSGTGSDGTAGLMAIKSEGGISFAQDPDSAKHDGMPRSAIKSGAVDFVLSPEGIAEEIIHISKRIQSGEILGSNKSSADLIEESDETLQRIFSLLQIHMHVDFSTYKPSTVGRRIQRQMRAHKHEDLKGYLEHLQATPAAVKELAEEMFIHVTEFFRDPDSFAELKKNIFPRLIKNRVAGVPIRIWVPGCSTGEEPYSIAMTLIEYLGVKATKTPIQIFATDISEAAVQKARTGIYKEADVEGVSEERLKQFFEKTKEGFKIKKSVRDLCLFSRHDVANSPPFARIDLLSCRNLLIYFAPNLQKQVMPVFHYALNSDGILWLGKSEAPSGFSKLFTLIDKNHKIYTKVNLPTPLNFSFPKVKSFVETVKPLKKNHAAYSSPMDSQREFDRILMSRYAPAGVMINANFEITQVRGHTGPFMELPSGQPNHNLFKMLRRELLPAVRMVVQTAVSENKSVRREDLSYEFGSERRKVNVEAIPVNMLSPPEERQYLIVFENNADSAKASRPGKNRPSKAGPTRKQSSSKENYIRQLLDEVDSLRDYQQSLSEGYESSQEELTAANEELQSANEELQSTNEEMETAKEELQAANEEMSTVNEELQQRNSELLSLNEQLALSEERFRLLVEGVRDYAIFLLNPEGRVATWNEGARRLKGYETNEILGKHFSVFYPQEKIAIRFPEKELSVATAEGRFEDEGWRIRKDGSRFWANVIITRINDKNGRMLGFSKITRDLTERKQLEERFRLLVEGVKDYAIFRMDPQGNITTWNEGARRLGGYAADQIMGENFSVLYSEEEVKRGKPAYDLKMAASAGRHEDEGFRIRRDGSRFWANTIITRIDDEDGNLVGFSKVIRDLTDRKKMEDELRKSRDELEVRVKERTAELELAKERIEAEKQKISSLFVQAPVPIAVFEGPNQIYRFANDPYLKMIDRFDVIGKPFVEVFPELRETDTIRSLQDAFHSGQRMEVVEKLVPLKNPATGAIEGRYFNYTLQPFRDSNGNIEGLMTVAHEVTSEVISRRAVEESENQLRAFANSITQLAWMALPDGHIYWYNDRWYEYTGTTPQQMAGWGWQTVHHPQELPKVLEKWRSSLDHGKAFEMEFPLLGADGQYRWFLTRSNPYRDSNGKIVRWFGTNTNVDEQRKNRDQLTAALRARDEFLSIASHELKTPLTSLKLQFQMARRDLNSEANEVPSLEDLIEFNETSIRQINSLVDLVEDLLDTSRVQTGNFTLSVEKVNLSELIPDIVNRMSGQLKNAGVTVKTSLNAKGEGCWDRHRIEQVLVNLISNAIKYAPRSPIHISTENHDDCIILVVQDFGPGIPEDLQAKVFDKFERARASKSIGGLGLGLFIVRKIIETHQGKISLESQEGKGAKFVIELPVKPDLPPTGGADAEDRDAN